MILPFPHRSRGFTLIEVLVAMTLTGIVVAGTLRALSAQKRFYARQARILDARHAMRASTIILASEFREVSAASGDFYFLASDSVGFRSTVGFGIACAIDAGNGVLSLSHVSGHFRTEAGDSVLVYVENSRDEGDDSWRATGVVSISTTGPSCAQGETARRHVTVSGSVAGVWVGAPVRLFRPYVYALFEMEGRWWLGRRNRAAAGGYVPVAGPLAPPVDDGLDLVFFDTLTRTPTWDPSIVGRIEINVRAPTYRSQSDPAYRDMSTSTYLRNNR
ncbi:MAG: type II secretion system protein [Gemmatimonadetes bacterium]|uniref:Type II secretion system protein n=1 Tax=Candidatus Kutchimonas denitrificans TaxID=3056748 RepID=A0AAE4ZB47_9BACT|nr:type II secretion system protein [Gemmatimonadota bacterium]NIR74185.1 type II secretion system protein [Candidatus Kutchimonas denitrificans]NIR99807.1 type II secretion system protein [Gemmatimonadota bacterium]NIT65396.1 type II secretion system protein [Gemmatimonadota bacterium]NIU51762.1 prepilin-type N-terminal cleavage/methylation domain-containing protein [Gemmatimonadota bacterium]